MPPIPHVEPATVQVTMVSGAIWIPPSSVTTDPRYAVLLRGLPNYQDLLLRKLGGVLIAVGSVFELTVIGNRCAFRIESINDCRDIVACVNRTLTRIVILPGAVPIERTPTGGIDVLVKNLTQLIVDSYSNANAHCILNIPPIKTALIHGAAGIGKATLVKNRAFNRTVCLTLGCNLHALSISTVLTVKDQVDEEAFGTIDPVKMIFDRAKISAPSVIMIKDLDLLCRDSTVDSTVKSSVIKILLKEIDGLGSNEKVFLIGISRNRSKLPEILRKPELFQYDLPVPVPSRLTLHIS
ncbi:hypothetical protein BC938DRAFT_471651 [Jimgerdemannia flammicorona]|uniref:ATPase AAA-type core domain-containing protein n=1 Tax=Jimgerdemannia flammicorona TaxID=994334 RepID=A0A433R013_9FUNG|nr:hypothetical protein BC938DRAFT_471651 [Jimgerdemannia flammicorona]